MSQKFNVAQHIFQNNVEVRKNRTMSQKINVAKYIFQINFKVRKNRTMQKNIFFKLMLKLEKNGTVSQSLLLIKVN